jgi:DNA-binding NarL/FixJ family response regulator
MKQEKKSVLLISNDSIYEQKIALMLKSNERFALRKIASNKSTFFEHLRTSNKTPDIVLITDRCPAHQVQRNHNSVARALSRYKNHTCL